MSVKGEEKINLGTSLLSQCKQTNILEPIPYSEYKEYRGSFFQIVQSSDKVGYKIDIASLKLTQIQ